MAGVVVAVASTGSLVAFDHFLEEIGDAPFILAGHSQGTAHAGRLLRERIDGTEILERMVAAYLVGFSIEKDQVGKVPVCDHARATRCVVGWNSVDGESGGPRVFVDRD